MRQKVNREIQNEKEENFDFAYVNNLSKAGFGNEN